jgi:hypothetical protein
MERLNLSQIVEEIKKTKPFVEENLETGNQDTLNTRRGRQARAIETMKELKENYTQTIRRGTVFIVIAGEDKNEFTKIALTKSNAFTADPEDFYKDLLKEIHPSMYRSGPNNIFDILGRILEDKMLSLNVLEYPQPRFKESYSRGLNSEADVLQLIKDIVNDQVGGEIAGVNAIQQIVPAAIEKGYKSNVTPLILNTNDEKLALRLIPALNQITPYVFLVVAGKSTDAFNLKGSLAVAEVNEKSVKATMKTIEGMVKRV